jgi:hypothetical protein
MNFDNGLPILEVTCDYDETPESIPQVPSCALSKGGWGGVGVFRLVNLVVIMLYTSCSAYDKS